MKGRKYIIRIMAAAVLAVSLFASACGGSARVLAAEPEPGAGTDSGIWMDGMKEDGEAADTNPEADAGEKTSTVPEENTDGTTSTVPEKNKNGTEDTGTEENTDETKSTAPEENAAGTEEDTDGEEKEIVRTIHMRTEFRKEYGQKDPDLKKEFREEILACIKSQLTPSEAEDEELTERLLAAVEPSLAPTEENPEKNGPHGEFRTGKVPVVYRFPDVAEAGKTPEGIPIRYRFEAEDDENALRTVRSFCPIEGVSHWITGLDGFSGERTATEGETYAVIAADCYEVSDHDGPHAVWKKQLAYRDQPGENIHTFYIRDLTEVGKGRISGPCRLVVRVEQKNTLPISEPGVTKPEESGSSCSASDARETGTVARETGTVAPECQEDRVSEHPKDVLPERQKPEPTECQEPQPTECQEPQPTECQETRQAEHPETLPTEQQKTRTPENREIRASEPPENRETEPSQRPAVQSSGNMSASGTVAGNGAVAGTSSRLRPAYFCDRASSGLNGAYVGGVPSGIGFLGYHTEAVSEETSELRVTRNGVSIGPPALLRKGARAAAAVERTEEGGPVRFRLPGELFEKEGVYRVSFVSRDAAGTKVDPAGGQDGSLTFCVDRTAPALSAVRTDQKDGFRLMLEAIDTGGVKRVRVIRGGGTIVDRTIRGTRKHVSLAEKIDPPAGDGTGVQIVLEDQAGNVETVEYRLGSGKGGRTDPGRLRAETEKARAGDGAEKPCGPDRTVSAGILLAAAFLAVLLIRAGRSVPERER